MDDKAIFRIAMIFTILGILGLMTASHYIIPEYNAPDSSLVRIRGEVQDSKAYGSTAKLSIEHSDISDIVLFDAPNSSIKKGQIVEIIGKVSDGEIIADKVSVLQSLSSSSNE